MSRFCIVALFRPDTIAAHAWEWGRISQHLAERCGEISAAWSLTAQHVRHPTTGAAHVVVRAVPEEPNMEAWGELYASSEALAQALSDALETQVAVVAFELEDDHGLYARWERGKPVEAETRLANPLGVAAKALGAHEATLRELVRQEEPGLVPSAEPEIDAEDFAEQQWLSLKQREAQEWMQRYRALKQHGRAGGSEDTKP